MPTTPRAINTGFRSVAGLVSYYETPAGVVRVDVRRGSLAAVPSVSLSPSMTALTKTAHKTTGAHHTAVSAYALRLLRACHMLCQAGRLLHW